MGKGDETPTISVVTTEPGTFGVEGIASIGTERVIPVTAFSKSWMRPKSAADVKVLQGWLKGQEVE